MTQPKDPRVSLSKSPQVAASRSGGMNMGMRSYTMGNQVKSRQMFIFNADGTIKGVREISPAQDRQLQGSAPLNHSPV